MADGELRLDPLKCMTCHTGMAVPIILTFSDPYAEAPVFYIWQSITRCSDWSISYQYFQEIN